MYDLVAPIFIVGVGRSGTTLLRSLLSAHSRVAIAPETHYMKLANRRGDLARGRPVDFEDFWRRFVATGRFADLGISEPKVLAGLRPLRQPDHRSIFGLLLALYAGRWSKPRAGEKSPSHVDYIGELLRWFPEARVIAMQRDPRAAAASKLTVDWAVHAPRPSLRQGIVANRRQYHLVQTAARWARVHEVVLPPWQHDDRVRTVRYEDLVADPVPVLRALCGFIGEDYEDAMLRTRDAARDPAPDRNGGPSLRGAAAHYERARQPVNTASLNRWQQRLTTAEITTIEAICHRSMAEAGYPLLTPAADRNRFETMARRHLRGLKAAEWELDLRRRLGRPARFVERLVGRSRA